MSAFDQTYYPTNWINNETPINESNLNHVENGIIEMQDRTNLLRAEKIGAEYVQSAIKNVSIDDATGIFTFTRYDNSTFTVDTKLEKVVTNFVYKDGKLILTLQDGTKQEIDMSAFITESEFVNSNRIAFSLVDSHVVTADIKSHSIGEEQLRTDYLAEIQTESANAHTDAVRSRSYAIGDTNTREGEETDNAKYYKDKTLELAQYAKDASVVGDFQLDSNGNLIYEDNSVHIFTVDDNGNLLYEVKGAI